MEEQLNITRDILDRSVESECTVLLLQRQQQQQQQSTRKA